MRRIECIVLALIVAGAWALSAWAQPPDGPPGGRRPRGGPPPWDRWQTDSRTNLEKPPLATDEAEKRILAVLDDVDRNEREMSVSQTDGRFLRQMAEALGAKRVVELGTSTGYSGLWFALALRNTGGHLYTHEIDPERARIARENFEAAGVADLITIIDGDAHQTVSQHTEPIDIVFLDADKEGYIDYLEKLLPLVRPGGLVLAHNMRRPPPDPRYIEAITTNPALDTTFVLMDGAGIGVTLKKRAAE
jgi:predicted O-methyltransferase YrrM